MGHSNRHDPARTGPVFYVPESFHPESFLPPSLLTHAQSAHYILHSIMTRMAFGERDGARLKREYVENIVGTRAYPGLIDCLLAQGEIVRRGRYIKGQQSFQYLPGRHHESQRLRWFIPTDPGLLSRLAKARQSSEQSKQNWRPIHKVWQQWQRRLQVNMEQAREQLALLPPESNPYDVQTLMLDRIHRQEYRLKVDDYGRIHNSITSLSRTLRPALRIKGQPTVHVDIVNSQPALLAIHIRQTRGSCSRRAQSLGTEGNHQAENMSLGISGHADTISGPRWGERAEEDMRGNGDRGTGGEGEEGQDVEVARSSTIYEPTHYTSLEGLGLYEELATGGRLYEYLMAQTGLPRATVKKALLRDVFGKRGSYPCPLEDAFRASFPGVHQFIRWFNRDDHAALLRELQRVESDLVIHCVGRRLKELGCTGCISLHDAVFCSRRDIGTVEQAFRDEMQAMGIQLNLEVAA